MRKVRLGQFSPGRTKVARLVLDLSGRAPYRIIDGADGVRIVFGESGEAVAATDAPLAAMRAAEPEPLEPAPTPVIVANARPTAVEPLALPPLPDPQVPAAPREPAAAPEQANVGTACGVTGNLGTPISLDFKDGDLQDIFRLFADISGLNVVVNPGVTGKVTLKLTEVPWDQALDLILKTNGLGYVLEDNVIRIAKLTDLQREEQERRKLQDEKELAGDLIDLTQRISYAKATELSDVLKKAGRSRLAARSTSTSARTPSSCATCPATCEKAQGPDRRARHGDAPGRDRGPDRGHHPQLHPRPRHPVGLRRGRRPAVRQHHEPRLPERDRPERRRRAERPSGSRPTTAGPGGLSSDAGIGTAGRGYAVNLPASAFNTGDRHLDGQHPGQLQPRRGADRARAAGPRAPPLDAEGDDPEQQGGRDQAGRPDPDPDAGEQHRHACTSRTRC